MPSPAARLTPPTVVLWLVLGALVPRLSPLRPVYLVNTYALLPALLGAALFDQALRSRGRRTFRIGGSDAALAAFLLWAVGSIALQHLPYAAIRNDLTDLWRTFVIPVVAFWAIRLARSREGEFANWVAPLAALGAVELAVGLLAWFTPAALPGFWPGLIQETGGVRITGTLPQPDLYAAVLMFCATFLVSPGMTAASRWTRYLANGCFALALTGVFLSFSRASWLGGLAALALLAAAHRRTIAGPCAAVALAITVLAFAPAHGGKPPAPSPAPAAPASDVGGYAFNRLTMTWTIRDRIVLDAAGFRMFLAKPLLGWGFGTYDRRAHEFVRTVGPFAATDWDKNEAASHCTHLSILAEMGAVGYGLFIFPAASLATAMVRCRKELWRDRFLVGLWAMVAFLAVVGLLIDLRYVPLSLTLGGVVLGLIAVRVEADEPQR